MSNPTTERLPALSHSQQVDRSPKGSRGPLEHSENLNMVNVPQRHMDSMPRHFGMFSSFTAVKARVISLESPRRLASHCSRRGTLRDTGRVYPGVYGRTPTSFRKVAGK